MSESRELTLPDAAATLAAGRRLARALESGGIDQWVIYLRGDLGAGKTTFARGFLEGWGHTGRVPSPTYTLIEPYELGHQQIYHVDLYRLEVSEQVHELAIPELAGPGAIFLIEWPERGPGELPSPDLEITLAVAGDGRCATYLAAESATDRLLATL